MDTLWRAAIVALMVAGGCGGDDVVYATAEELRDPEVCKECHPKHYEEWASSMHAYAADDPVFLAMNARGQQETGGELGNFCVKCHAPMAVLIGATTDGSNLSELPQDLKGVTCYFCHNVVEITQDHNAGVRLAQDNVLRAGVDDPVDNGFHRSAYSSLHDRRDVRSSELCGSCHDIVNGHGVRIERTFQEYKSTVFFTADQGKLSCGACHMQGFDDEVVADFDGVPTRTRHEHTLPGVDVAITPWPGKELQLAGIERDLDAVISATLCVSPEPLIKVRLDNVFSGHMLPSGAAADRRMWIEVAAYRGDELLFESGKVAAGEPVVDLVPDEFVVRDHLLDGDGNETHNFWDAQSFRSRLLTPAITNDPTSPDYFHAVDFDYVEVAAAQADRVTMVVHLRPIGLDVLDDLIDTGYLDESFRAEIPTFTLESTRLQWSQEHHGYNTCATPANQVTQ